jgi:hypothetical protein
MNLLPKPGSTMRSDAGPSPTDDNIASSSHIKGKRRFGSEDQNCTYGKRKRKRIKNDRWAEPSVF